MFWDLKAHQGILFSKPSLLNGCETLNWSMKRYSTNNGNPVKPNCWAYMIPPQQTSMNQQRDSGLFWRQLSNFWSSLKILCRSNLSNTACAIVDLLLSKSFHLACCRIHTYLQGLSCGPLSTESCENLAPNEFRFYSVGAITRHFTHFPNLMCLPSFQSVSFSSGLTAVFNS